MESLEMYERDLKSLQPVYMNIEEFLLTLQNGH